jgi:hypothetical protein
MKQLLFLFLVLFSVNAFCVMSDEEELANLYKDATDPISLDDFPDIAKEKPLKCAYFWSGGWWDHSGLASHTRVKVGAGKAPGKGPLFPGVKGKETGDKGLVAVAHDYDKQVDVGQLELKDSEIKWTYTDTIFNLRRKGPYIFFQIWWNKNTQTAYGYCWREKN